MPFTFPQVGQSVFGTSLKQPYDQAAPPSCSRVNASHKFLNWSWWPVLTSWAVSTVFGRWGFHGKVFLFFLYGLGVFLVTLIHDVTDDHTIESQTFSKSSLSLSVRLLTFQLASYVGILVATYWTNVRRKTRNMNYGLSNAVDTLATTLDYNHPNTPGLLDAIYGPLVVIGQYGLTLASKTSAYQKSPQDILALFERHQLDGTYLLHTYPPKQILHTLRLAILQEIQKERQQTAAAASSSSSCLQSMCNEDFIELRKQLNDYSGWSSSTSSSVSSSKLPFGYVHFINWSTHAILFMIVFQMFQEQGSIWCKSDICWSLVARSCHEETDRPPDAMEIIQLLMHFLFQIITLYYVLGSLELYHVLEQSFSSGLVVQNYYGIIELICAPLRKTRGTPYYDNDDEVGADTDAGHRTYYAGPIELHRLQKKRGKTL